MKRTKDETYKSIIDITAVLFLIAYILSSAARNDFIPTIFGYIALALVMINLALHLKSFRIAFSPADKKTKKKRIANFTLAVITNLILAVVILGQ